MIGVDGSGLSTGQKQRIAIARALIRKPKILLMDEATSALDSQSEKLVKNALYKGVEGRTTIAVAHRLNTIREADVIYVIDKGKVVEKGNYVELLALRGLFWELERQQELENGINVASGSV